MSLSVVSGYWSCILPSGSQAGRQSLRQVRRENAVLRALQIVGNAVEGGAPLLAIENGKRRVEALEREALAALYKHPVSYFLEGALEQPETIRALAREAHGLTETDREEVLRFAQFLKSYGKSRGVASRGDVVER